MPALSPIDTDQIVITASRLPEVQAESPASVTVLDGQQIQRFGQPQVPALLRLTPSVAVATAGPPGSFAEVRIRGAENNHTVLFIDGIRANDPASGDFARFELLNADLASRVEVVRGPQSALWGSDAIGGVVAINGTEADDGLTASLEGGSDGFARASGSASVATSRYALAGAVGWQRANGIDSFGAPGGDKDGYRNHSGRIRGTVDLSSATRVGLSGFALTGRSQFDGYDPDTFERTDTLDNTRNRLAAGRVWVEFGRNVDSWSGRIGASLLGSSNRNYLSSTALNRTNATRRTIDTQVERRFSTGAIDHALIAAAETDHETFHARGFIAGLATDQDRRRSHQAFTGEWRVRGGRFSGDLAVRHDVFDRFKDSTTVRAGARAEIGKGFALAFSYGEGMAPPTFFDLYGTFPNNFVGNPDLRPETSRGIEGSLRFRGKTVRAALTAFRQKLRHEIVDVFDFSTFLSSTANSAGVSRRAGIEAEIAWQPSPRFRLLANYAYLDATQPDSSTGQPVRERRRPKHSGSIAADGAIGRWSYGASIAYAGPHIDTLEVAPYGPVRVDPYWIADARLAYAVRSGLEVFVRGSNLFDTRYEEVAGYRTPGIGGFVGIRLADRRSSP